MELNSPYGKVSMSHGHYFTFLSSCNYFQIFRQPAAYQRMVPHYFIFIGGMVEYNVLFSRHQGNLAMHWPNGLFYLATEVLANSLVPEANAQEGFLEIISFNQFQEISCVFRNSRTGRQYHRIKNNAFGFVWCNIIFNYDAFLTELPEVVHQVIGEGIVIVYQKNQWEMPLRKLPTFSKSWPKDGKIETRNSASSGASAAI